MPSIVGSFKIVSVSQGSIVQIGDAVQLAPQSTSKYFAGAGSFNAGDFPRTNNAISSTNTNDQDVKDSNQAKAGNSGVA
ncbi:spore germination protein [Paenibacillus xerothermodurans]|uniref:Spore germination protein n=1 Tax=Paenibacillus xerothermodurans TaxID=1977292 RepID=A0A2W1NGY0_PAEXE|nr:spore germination protein [Paenibacillus xerothermodurans]PZE22371.1 spore germination protein [Paenibacillus xerothermodurans]